LISYTATTDPRTLITTLTETRLGRYDTLVSEWTAMTPGTACAITGFTALSLTGRGRIDRSTGPLPRIHYTFSGIVGASETETLKTPTRTFRMEERTFRTNYEGVKIDVSYLSPVCETFWASDALQTNPKYTTNINTKDDPEPISCAPVNDDPFPAVALLLENTHYEVETISGWTDQAEDQAGMWQNVEYAAKILKEP